MHAASNKNKLMFVLHSSKTHGLGDKPQIIKIQGYDLQDVTPRVVNRHCPFRILQQYIAVRKQTRAAESEQFFVFRNRTPLTAAHFRSVLDKLLTLAGLDKTMYGSHGFHAGHAIDMLECLHRDVGTIRKFGRWRSNVVYRYLSM